MKTGFVHLVGAGPGAADLITVRGLRSLLAADTILIDSLLPKSYLDALGVPTEGKNVVHLQRGVERWDQDRINAFMAEEALRGKVVARLKGGDPGVFGHLSEEADFLTGNGIPWDVIPGLSVCTAAPTACAMPLTRRRHGRSFAVATAKVEGGGLVSEFPAADTLVVYMGVGALPQVTETLLSSGWPAWTGAAVIEAATTASQRVVRGTLETIARAAVDALVGSPAILLVGAAASDYQTSGLGLSEPFPATRHRTSPSSDML